jgi:hypothetical protein
MTAEVAEAWVRLSVLKDLALTEDLERARQQLERVPKMIKAQDLSMTPELEQSRRRRDEFLAKATEANADASRAKAHVQGVKARVQ